MAAEYERLTGRRYGLFEEYMLSDAEVAVVVLNSTAGTTKAVVDKLRSRGIKAGLLKPRVFRPFPYDEIREALGHVKGIAVLDKAEGFSGAGGPLFTEVGSALQGIANVEMTSYIYGLGGRDVTVDHIESVFMDLKDRLADGKGNKITYLGIHE